MFLVSFYEVENFTITELPLGGSKSFNFLKYHEKSIITIFHNMIDETEHNNWLKFQVDKYNIF